MRNKGNNRYIMSALLFILIVCLILMSRAYVVSVCHKARQKEMIQAVVQEQPEKQAQAGEKQAVTEAEQSGEPEAVSMPAQASEQEKTPMLAQYAVLYEKNSDMTGWLSIEGTVIDYPVMRCKDNEYYLHHDFYGEDDKYGCLFVKDIADVDTPDTNFTIYGHNMKDGSMFGSLDSYQEKSFYREHTEISFDTLYEERSYQVMAVFLSQVYTEDAEVFKYYNFYEARTPEEFAEFYENVKELSLYDTEVTAEYGDTFLTLSTCAYHVEDGRFVVVAKRIK